MKNYFLLLFAVVLFVSCSCKQKSYEAKYTIDADLQSFVEKELVKQMDSLKASGGAVAIMEVNTGNIVAMVETSRGEVVQNDDSCLLRTPLETGSLFLPVSYMAALEDKKINPDKSVDTGNGIFRIDSIIIRDHNAFKGGYGKITASQVISFASNVGMAKMIIDGYEENPGSFIERIKSMEWNNSDAFTGINVILPATGAGFDKINDIWGSFGYLIKVKPIALLTFYNAIANDGCMVMSRLVDSTGAPAVVKENICSKETLEALRNTLSDVIKEGTGKVIKSDKVSFAGKTGTVMQRNINGGFVTVVSFCGYFPLEKPKYTCLVMLRNPGEGIPTGGIMAGSVFRTIAERVSSKNNL